ncbi:MAG: YfhO family protein [Lachnospiraceae bacterium]|nr:YfhO family protein [Lachnospiraceae bacterium]
MKVRNFINQRKYALGAGCLASIATIIILLIAGRFFDGQNHFLVSDLVAQHIPAIKDFHRALLGEESLFYSFSMGLGMPTAATYAFEVFSPFNLLFFWVQKPAYAATLVYIAKVFAAAYAFTRLQEVWLGKKNSTHMAFSILYALCGFAVGVYVNLRSFDAILILPYIVRGILLLKREGKHLCLILSYAYIFIVNYYTAYMVGIFTFLLFVCCLLTDVAISKRDKGRLFGKYVIDVIIAILCGMAVLLPAAAYIFGNYASDATTFQFVPVTPAVLLKGLFVGAFQSMSANQPLLYAGILSTICIPLFFITKEIGKREKIIAGCLILFLLVATFVPSVYLMMHCFDAPDQFPYRFAFLYPFVFCAMGTYAVHKCGMKVEKRGKLSVGIALLVYILCLAITKEFVAENRWVILTNLALLGCYFLFFLFVKKEKGKGLLIALAFLEVVLNGVFTFGRRAGELTQEMEGYGTYYEAMDGVVIPEKETTRACAYDEFFENDAQTFGYMGTELFSSVENPKVRKFLNTLGNATSVRYVTDLGMTDITKMILSVGYELHLVSTETGYEPNVEEREYTLPLAFLCSEDILDFTFEDANAFYNNNILLAAMIGEYQEPYKLYLGKIYVDTENMDFLQDERGYYLERLDSNLMGRVMFWTDAEENVYMYLKNTVSANSPFSMRIITTDKPKWTQEALVDMPSIVSMGKGEHGNREATICADGSTVNSTVFTSVTFATLDEDVLQKTYEELAAGGAYDVERKNSHIAFSVDVCDGKSVLFISIPYEEGWHVRVDGEVVPICPLLENTFIGIQLMEGTHRVEMYYFSKYNLWGIIGSVLGVLLLIFRRITEKSQMKPYINT